MAAYSGIKLMLDRLLRTEGEEGYLGELSDARDEDELFVFVVCF